MRSATTARLKLMAAVAVLLSGPVAVANEGSYKQVRGWSLYRNESNCSAFMMFENNEAVGFTYDAPGRSTRVTFSDAEATSYEDGASPTLDILLRQPDGTVDNALEDTVFMVTVDEDGRRTLTSRWLGPPALDSFRTAALVGFFDGDREIGIFNLSGTAAALEEVRQCSAQVSGRGAD